MLFSRLIKLLFSPSFDRNVVINVLVIYCLKPTIYCSLVQVVVSCCHVGCAMCLHPLCVFRLSHTAVESQLLPNCCGQEQYVGWIKMKEKSEVLSFLYLYKFAKPFKMDFWLKLESVWCRCETVLLIKHQWKNIMFHLTKPTANSNSQETDIAIILYWFVLESSSAFYARLF